MKKIVIGILILVVGLSSFLFIPGGFIKDNVSISNPVAKNISSSYMLKEPEQQEFPKPFVDPSVLPEVRIPYALSEPVPAPLAVESVMMSPVEAVAVGRSMFNDLYGIVKDLLSLVATLYGLKIAKQTIDEKKKKSEPAKEV